MFKKIAIAIAAAIALVCIVAAMQPSDFSVARSATINVGPSLVFPMINNLKNWEQWSPYMGVDPDMKSTFEGPAEGEGAVHGWDGPKMGQGKMTVTKSVPNERVDFLLEFVKPMVATNTATFTLAPNGPSTDVTWSMAGKNNFIGKVFCLFMNMDKMVGGDFEKGLAKLKQTLEAPTTTEAAAPTATEDK